MIEPTLHNLQWICQNAEKAWQENDPKRYEYWEQQKKLFFRACYERVESLTKQMQYLNAQQQKLLEKAKHGYGDPIEINNTNRIITEQKEQVSNQLKYYSELIKYLDKEQISPLTPNLKSFHYTEKRRSRVTAISLFNYIFFTNFGQIILCSVLLIMSISGIWILKTKDKRVEFEIRALSESYLQIRITNRSFFPARLCFAPLNRWQLLKSTYLLECSTYLTQKNTSIDLPIQCVQMGDEPSHFPLTIAEVEIPVSIERTILIDIPCLLEQLPEIKQITLTIKTSLFSRPVTRFTWEKK